MHKFPPLYYQIRKAMILDDSYSYLVKTPLVWIGITLTNFKRLGKTPVSSETLMMLHKGTRI